MSARHKETDLGALRGECGGASGSFLRELCIRSISSRQSPTGLSGVPQSDFPDNSPDEPDFHQKKLGRIFDQASELSTPQHLRDQLGYRHITHLADVFDGWALDSGISPEQSAQLVGWSDGLRRLAEEVGEGWNPPKPDQLSLMGFLGRWLLDE